MNYKIKRIFFIGLLLNLLHFIFLMICNISILKNIKQFKIKHIAVYGGVCEGQEIPILESENNNVTIEQGDEGDDVAEIQIGQEDNVSGSPNKEEKIKTLAKNQNQDKKITSISEEISKELLQIDKIKNKINELINTNEKSELTEFLNNNEKWQEAETTYNKIKEHQKANKLEEALKLLKPSQSWKKWIASFFVNSSNPTLKNVYETILNEIKTKLTNLEVLADKLKHLKPPKEEKKSWWHKLVNFWSIVSAKSAETTTQNTQNTIPAVLNFFLKHPFFTKTLAKFLGEKTEDLPSIVSNLSRGIFDAAADQVKIQADIAKNTVPKQAKNAIKQHIQGIIIASVAATALVITFIFCIINKIKNNKTSAKK